MENISDYGQMNNSYKPNDPTANSYTGSSKMTDWKNEPTIAQLQRDYNEARSEQAKIREKIDRWDLYDAGGPKITTKKPRASKLRPRLIKKQREWKYPEMEEPFLSAQDMFKITPRTAEDADGARWNMQYLNYQWDVLIDKVQVVGDIIRADVDKGTAIVKVGWEVEYDIKSVEKEVPVYATPEETMVMLKESVQAGQMDAAEAKAMIMSGEPFQIGTKLVYEDEEVRVKNQPRYEIRDPRKVIIDPTCDGDVSKAMFIIDEYQTSLSELKKNEYSKKDTIIKTVGSDGQPIETTKEVERGYYRNLDNIKTSDGESYDENRYKDPTVNFQFADESRKKITAFDYWGYWDIDGSGKVVPIIATWVGSTLVRLEKNPLPFKQLPFAMAKYMPVDGSPYGDSDAELIMENQDVIGKLKRASLNIINSKSAGQRFIHNSIVQDATQKSNLDNGLDVIYKSNINPKDAVYSQDIEAPSQAFQNMVGFEQMDAESFTGARFNNVANGTALGSTAAAVRSTMNSVSKRNLSVLRRLNKLFEDLARMTVAMNQAYLEDEEIIRVTNGDHVSIRRDDLAGNFDLVIDVSTAESDNERAQELSFMLQTMGNTADPRLVNMILVEIARLRKMIRLANKLEELGNTPPPVDPVLEETKKLQLESAKLENWMMRKRMEDIDSKIIERITRADENKIDQVTKAAKAKLDEAIALRTLSERDKIDYETVEKSEGVDVDKRVHETEAKGRVADAEAMYKENQLLKKMLEDIKNKTANTQTQDRR